MGWFWELATNASKSPSPSISPTATDELIARFNDTNFLTALQLITTPAQGVAIGSQTLPPLPRVETHDDTVSLLALAKPIGIDAAVTVDRGARSGVVRGEKMRLEIASPGVLVTLNVLEMGSDPTSRLFRLRQAAVTGAIGNDEFHLAVETANYLKPTDRLTATGVTVDWFGTGMEGRAELPSLFVDSLWADVIFPAGNQRTNIRFGYWESALKYISEAVVGNGKINFSVFDWSNSLAFFGVSIPEGRWSPLVPAQGHFDVSIGKRGIDICLLYTSPSPRDRG